MSQRRDGLAESPGRPAALFFDMGGTLETLVYDDTLRLAASRRIQAVLRDAGAGLDVSAEQLMPVLKAGFARYDRDRTATCRELPAPAVCQRYLLAEYLSGDPGLAAVLEAVGEELAFIWDTAGYARVLRPEVPALLELAQQRGLRLGIISNTLSVRQVYHDLERFAIGRYFDPVVLSTACGYRKPGRQIFHLAARLAGVAPSACIYVGDSPYHDVAGALGAGFGQAVWLAAPLTEAHLPPPAETPAITIASLAELGSLFFS